MKRYDIHERIFALIIEVLSFAQKLPRTPVNQTIIPQIINSATSMGANDQEADGAATRKEFVHRYSIVRKEGKETAYWLRLIESTNHARYQEQARKLQDEIGEVVAIVSKIILNTNTRVTRRKK